MDGERKRGEAKAWRKGDLCFAPLFCSRLAGKPVRELVQETDSVSGLHCKLMELSPFQTGLRRREHPVLVLTSHNYAWAAMACGCLPSDGLLHLLQTPYTVTVVHLRPACFHTH